MSALRHQSDEGGSWAVRGSLAQTGHFLAELGQVDDLAVEPPPPEVLDLHTMTTESAFGTLSHIAAQGHVGGRSGYDLPPSPVGTHPPAWW